jgi:hypothetical protein
MGEYAGVNKDLPLYTYFEEALSTITRPDVGDMNNLVTAHTAVLGGDYLERERRGRRREPIYAHETCRMTLW